jgi:hypothetical protein
MHLNYNVFLIAVLGIDTKTRGHPVHVDEMMIADQAAALGNRKFVLNQSLLVFHWAVNAFFGGRSIDGLAYINRERGNEA